MTTEISPGIVESPQGDTVVSIDNGSSTCCNQLPLNCDFSPLHCDEVSLDFVDMFTLLVIGWPLGCLFVVCLSSLCPWSFTGLLMFEWLRPQAYHVPVSASIFPYWIFFFQVVGCFLLFSLDHLPLCPDLHSLNGIFWNSLLQFLSLSSQVGSFKSWSKPSPGTGELTQGLRALVLT